MELYLEDWTFLPYGDSRLLQWDLPSDVEAPASRAQPHGAHRRVGELITIAPTTPEELAMVERVCDTPQEVVDVIGEFSNLTLLYINCHSIDDQGRSDATARGTVSGIQLGGARIYERHLRLFGQISSSFSFLNRTEPMGLGIVHSTSQAEFRITAQAFNEHAYLFVPRIMMRSCSIGNNQSFCQLLANTTETWVFAPTVDQRYDQAGPWQLHGPVRVFIPASLAHLQDFRSSRDISPFSQRLGQQRIATGSGRGLGWRRGPIGYA